MAQENPITPRDKDFAEWYGDVIAAGQLADYSPVKGCMVIRPNGYGIWERLQAELDRRIKETGHENAYFPLLIPKSYFDKEAEHVEGFAAECAAVTHGGGKPLEEPLYIRPTSEAIICTMYGKWVSSWRDLPILVNQWANVVRWEMRTRLFLRTMEFLWQEGHTAHETHMEAVAEVLRMLDVYADLAENVLAIPVLKGRKTAAERFAGAMETLCIEAMMQNGWALQAGTSHDLGQTFAKAYGIEFQGRDGSNQLAWSTSWGVSTRLVGAVIMVHGDDAGVVVPPRLAPVQAVILPIPGKTDEESKAVKDGAEAMLADLKAAGVRARVDDRDNLRPGAKHYEWERKGTPVRIEFGPRDAKAGTCVLVRRDVKGKNPAPVAGLGKSVAALLETIQGDMLARARKWRDERTYACDDYARFKTDIEAKPGFYDMRWCEAGECEAKVKDETKATIRCIPLDAEKDPGPCVVCGRPSAKRVIWARSY
jgi:prolyl-tRNA synthetase